MSIVTKRGDDGQTDLMYGRRVAKTDLRLEAGGAVDELNACLGLVRAHRNLSGRALQLVESVQECLIGLMGELATLSEDHQRYLQDGFAQLRERQVQELEKSAKSLEEECAVKFKDWARPGQERCMLAAHLDLARTVCRRAERSVLKLLEADGLNNPNIPIYLNRLSDLLWILARYEALKVEKL